MWIQSIVSPNLWFRNVKFSFINIWFQLYFDETKQIYMLSSNTTISGDDQEIQTNQISQAKYSANVLITSTLASLAAISKDC